MLPKIEPMTASTSGATATTANPVPLRQDARTIGLIGLAHGSSHFFHMLLPPLFPWLIGEFGFSYSELGLLVSVFFVISGVGQALAGFVVDRFGARPVLFAGLACFVGAGLSASLATGYGGLMVAARVASAIAAFPEVRSALKERQRAFRQAPGLVADGRDMGTVIFSDARYKVFLTASAEERARRRYLQLKGKVDGVSLSSLLDEIRARDERDTQRAVAPLKPAADAIQLDSTELSIEQVLERIMSEIAIRDIAG